MRQAAIGWIVFGPGTTHEFLGSEIFYVPTVWMVELSDGQSMGFGPWRGVPGPTLRHVWKSGAAYPEQSAIPVVQHPARCCSASSQRSRGLQLAGQPVRAESYLPH
jgi:hypothetical protein